MNFWVGWVIKLLQQNVAIWLGRHNLFGFGDRAFHAFSAFGQDQVRTQCFEQFATLQTHGFWHGQGQTVTTCSGDISQSNPSIATGGLNQLFVFGQDAAFFGIPDHVGTNPAFHAEARVTGFHFDQHIARADAVQAYQRGMTNGL